VKLKRIYSFSDKRQIWRLLISDSNKLIIETRDIDRKEVFFHCIDFNKGKLIFKNLQMEEKYWVGIEAIYNEIIFFHMFAKPNMPEHKKIISFDIGQNKVIWQNDALSFISVYEDKVYASLKKFDSKQVFTLDYINGNVIEDFGNNVQKFQELLNDVQLREDYSKYLYPSNYMSTDNSEINNLIFNELNKAKNIENIQFLKYGEFLFYNYYEKLNNNLLDNVFSVYNIEKKKKVSSEVINKNVNSISPDSFFVTRIFCFF